MKHRSTLIAGLAALLCGAYFFGVVTAQHDHDAHQHGEMTPEQMQEMWMQFAEPGPAHERLASFEGEYRSRGKHWASKDATPEPMEFTSKAKMIYGGRYMVTNIEGEWMDMPFEGREIMGYDNMNNEYFAVWIDNMGTGLAISRGKWDTAKDALVMEGTMSSPMGPMKMRTITQKTNRGHVMEMYMDQGQGMYKSMELRSAPKN